MLFNSFAFLLLFLPFALGGYLFFLRQEREDLASGFLGLASLLFYGLWDWRFLPLLLASIVINFSLGRELSRASSPTRGDRRILVGGVTVNLGLLAYFKYANFFIGNLNDWLQVTIPFPELVLPLGISFFTFTQIAYLVDAFRKEVRDFNFPRYLLFVTFFPHLIAGPVLHHSEIMPQFRKFRDRNWTRFFAIGLTLFAFGLFKKTVIADSLSEFATPVFVAAAAGQPMSSLGAWGGAIAYTLQLYFDFSAYSDMAIGLALLFGIRFPANFNSPYQANSIIDFWRRWHMTLSRFLRDYLYIPLGGGRGSRWRRYRNLALTMLLGGLWHGAGWTFILWGGLHGLYLIVNHLWRDFGSQSGLGMRLPRWLTLFSSRFLTFVAVIVAWVFFRAESMNGAIHMLSAMAGWGGLNGQDPLFTGNSEFRWLLGCLLAVHLLPNALQCLRHYEPALETYPGEIKPPRSLLLNWQPTRGWVLITGLAALAGLLNMTRVSEFLYFQF